MLSGSQPIVLIRNFTIPKCPPIQAACNGVLPFKFVCWSANLPWNRDISADDNLVLIFMDVRDIDNLDIKYFTILKCPYFAAVCKGVQPFASLLSMVYPMQLVMSD